MAKSVAIGLAVVCLIALFATLAVFCHGLWARHQMNRYKRIADSLPTAQGRRRSAAKPAAEDD